MLDAIQSKTVLGLAIILIYSAIMSALGKLTPELVDIIKWVGTAYMGVRVVANAGESYVAGKGPNNGNNGS